MTPETIRKLKDFFPPHCYKDRIIPGGGKWLFIPWQHIKNRLDECDPNWSVSWGQPQYIDEYCAVSCSITIEGVTREAWGNAKIVELSKTGKDASRGTPIERATADAFKNAAEMFGVGAHLDDQKTLAQYLSNRGDGRARTKLTRRDRAAGKFTISPEEWEIIKQAGRDANLGRNGMNQFLAKWNASLDNWKNIPKSRYATILNELRNG